MLEGDCDWLEAESESLRTEMQLSDWLVLKFEKF